MTGKPGYLAEGYRDFEESLSADAMRDFALDSKNPEFVGIVFAARNGHLQRTGQFQQDGVDRPFTTTELVQAVNHNCGLKAGDQGYLAPMALGKLLKHPQGAINKLKEEFEASSFNPQNQPHPTASSIESANPLQQLGHNALAFAQGFLEGLKGRQ